VASDQYKALLESFRIFGEEQEIRAAQIYNNAFNNNKKV